MFFRKQLFHALALVDFCLIVILVSNPVELSPVQAALEPAKQPETQAREPLPRDAASLASTTAVTTTGSRGLVSSAQAGINSVAWHFGIAQFNAANKIEPKPAYCAFARYPEPCQPPPPPPPLPLSHYLPQVSRSPNLGCPR